jgi:hypothetical protein
MKDLSYITNKILREKKHLEDLGEDGRLLLKLIAFGLVLLCTD